MTLKNGAIFVCSPSQHQLNPSHPILNEIQRRNEKAKFVCRKRVTYHKNNLMLVKLRTNKTLPNVLRFSMLFNPISLPQM